MKKTFAYATIAAFLGVALMLVPLMPSLIVSTSRSAQTGGQDTYGMPLSPQNFAEAAKQSETSAGIMPNYPSDAVTVTLILLFSLAVAFSAYAYVRRSRFLKEKNMPF